MILLKIYFPKVIFREINNSTEIEKMHNLVWQIYGLEKKYFDVNQTSPKILQDKYEKNSIKIGAFNGDNLIGALRIILPSSEGFYVEEDFNVDLSSFPYDEIAEISRFVVLREYRKKLISFGLWKKALEISKMKKINYWIFVIPEKIKDYLSKSFGIKCYPIKTKELTEKQIKAREKMINYYKNGNPAPYIIFLKELY